MSICPKSTCLRLAVLLLLISVAFLIPDNTQAQIPDLTVTVGDTVGASGQTNSVITVFMTNTFDQVCAFNLQLKIVPPNILEFQTDSATIIDTTYWKCTAGTWPGSCTDSVATVADSAEFETIDTLEVLIGSIDTTGTLISGWEYLRSTSTESGLNIQVSGIADISTVPGSVPGVNPQGGGVLFTLLGDIQNVPDTAVERTASIVIESFLPAFNFSKCSGEPIGVITDTVEDTSYYVCDDWVLPDSIVCNEPREVLAGQPFEWIVIDTVTVGYLDTTAVKLFNGSLTVESFICGDANGSGDPEPTVADIGAIVDYLFITGTAPVPLERANTNCSTGSPLITVADIGALVDRLFITGAPLCCQ